MIKPTPQQFEEWRASPITEWLLDTFVKAEMARTRQIYQNGAWEGGFSNDEIAHAAHRERYDTLDWLRSLTMETIEATMEMQE